MATKLTQSEIDREAEHIRTYLCSCPRGTDTCTRAVAQAVLLKGFISSRGELYDVKAKSIGAGVYELSLKLRI